jgi:hypothetical protein
MGLLDDTFDLVESSCVNREIKVLNRKFKKKKSYNHTKVTDMSTNKDHYTKRGLHMNKSGKEWLTRSTADNFNKLFADQKPAPVTI